MIPGRQIVEGTVVDQFNPYQEWLGRPDGWQPANHYDLLGVTVFEKDVATIIKKADFLTSKIRRARPGAHLAQWQQLLDAIQTAKACLSDNAGKAAYDQSLEKAYFSSSPAEPSGAPQMATPPSVASADVLSDPPPMAPGTGSQVVSMERIALTARTPVPEPLSTPSAATKSPAAATPPGPRGNSPNLWSRNSAPRSTVPGAEVASPPTKQTAPMAEPFNKTAAPMAQPFAPAQTPMAQPSTPTQAPLAQPYAQSQPPMAQPWGGTYDGSSQPTPAQPMTSPGQNAVPPYPDPAVGTPTTTPAPVWDNNQVAYPNAAAYPNPAYPNQAYPSQGNPNPAYPNPTYPNQAYPAQAYPNQAYPNPAYPNQGYPEQAYPNQAYPNQGYPNQAYPNQGYPNQAYPNQAYPNSAYPNQGYPEQAYPNQAYPSQGNPNPAYSNPTYPNQGYPNQAYPNPTYVDPAAYANPASYPADPTTAAGWGPGGAAAGAPGAGQYGYTAGPTPVGTDPYAVGAGGALEPLGGSGVPGVPLPVSAASADSAGGAGYEFAAPLISSAHKTAGKTKPAESNLLVRSIPLLVLVGILIGVLVVFKDRIAKRAANQLDGNAEITSTAKPIEKSPPANPPKSPSKEANKNAKTEAGEKKTAAQTPAPPVPQTVPSSPPKVEPTPKDAKKPDGSAAVAAANSSKDAPKPATEAKPAEKKADAPAEPAIDPKKRQALRRALADARKAMSKRDLAGAKRAFRNAGPNAQTPAEQEEVTRVQDLLGNLEEFWKGIIKVVSGFSITQEVTLGKTSVIVIEASPQRFTFRTAGQNYSYTPMNMPRWLIEGLVAVGFAPRDPSTKILLGTFMAMDGAGDRQQAKKLWEDAIRQGQDVKYLLAELSVGSDADDSSFAAEETTGKGQTAGKKPSRTNEQKVAIPTDKAKLEKVEQALHEKFRADFDRANTALGKVELAGKLLESSKADSLDSDSRYVMLRDARDMAIAAGKSGLACEGIELMGESFKIDPWAHKIIALEQVIKKNRSQASQKEAYEVIEKLLPAARGADRANEARRLAELAVQAAQKTGNAALIRSAKALGQQPEGADKEK